MMPHMDDFQTDNFSTTPECPLRNGSHVRVNLINQHARPMKRDITWRWFKYKEIIWLCLMDVSRRRAYLLMHKERQKNAQIACIEEPLGCCISKDSQPLDRRLLPQPCQMVGKNRHWEWRLSTFDWVWWRMVRSDGLWWNPHEGGKWSTEDSERS